MSNSNKWVTKLNELYNEAEEEYKVKAIKVGYTTGFYLFWGSSNTGQLLCSDDMIAAFYEVEISNAYDKEPFYDLFRKQAMDSYGFKEEVLDPDLLKWRDIKEYVNSLTDEQLDEVFLATIGVRELNAIETNQDTNSLVLCG